MKRILLVLMLALAYFSVKAQHNGINLDFMDTSVKPQDDFYNYTNGTWQKNAEIPSDRGRWGSFDELREFTDSVSLGILQKSITQQYTKGADIQKVADLYGTFMDWESRNKLGIQPLKDIYKEIDKVKNIKDLQALLTENISKFGNPLLSMYVYTDMKNSTAHALYFSGPNLGLGRDYYQKEDENSKQTLSKYQNYLQRLDSVTGMHLTTSPEKVVEFEKVLANKLLTLEEGRDNTKRYNPVNMDEFKGMSQYFDFHKYLSDIGLDTDRVIISELEYYKSLDEVLNNSNIDLIKDFLKVRATSALSGVLNEELDQLNFDFYSKELRGIKEQRAMEKRALNVINGNVGEVLGKLYVKEVFPPEAKQSAEEMVSYIVKSFEQHINGLSWMSKKTKVKALEKLSKFNVKIGYPDEWKDYSTLEIYGLSEGKTYYDNMMNINEWEFKDNIAKLHKPVDKKEWRMNPQTVNAYYSPTNNEIVFPAAILQAPFFDFKADVAVNFGGIGAVIGHEISHGFDDSGAQYDGDGNLNNWWSKKDLKKFQAVGNALASQYDSYEPLPGIHVNGKFTLGENIADLGGVAVAYDGLKMYLKDKGNPGNIDGFTQEQRFFLSWATIWRTKSTDEAIENQVKVDPHSPGYYRAIGPLVNQESFFKAFSVKEGDSMRSENPIIIW